MRGRCRAVASLCRHNSPHAAASSAPDPTSSLAKPGLSWCPQMREKLAALQLSVKGVAQREKQREALGQGVKTPWFVHIPYTGVRCITASRHLRQPRV